ncbi:TPR repeat-containing protein yrrB [Hondaea fermentalgiana]|uniref:TPR repeat-containing protein yrrB n=1 Tax=Hondaea fermentalgiana TaxID=2315210 RepID=A0A2R5G0D7_9STRA|nr:TPR repeat-containing protein yrrB [Hondaea fermentalgiana]|eukprot:GBG24496.1 TPR repeat-containing protein yrrB [Hondaea fermentalgiana]
MLHLSTQTQSQLERPHQNNSPCEDDFAVNLNKELADMLRKAGPSQTQTVMAVLNEARLREEIGLPAPEPLLEELFELRGEDHSACDIGVRNARYFYDLGWETRCKGDLCGAVALLREAARRDPEDEKTWINLGYLEACIGEFQAARLSFQAAVRLAPLISVVHFNLGVVSLAAGYYQEAVDALDTAIALDASRPEFYRARALAHRRRVIDLGTGKKVKGDFYAASKDYLLVTSTPSRLPPNQHRLNIVSRIDDKDHTDQAELVETAETAAAIPVLDQPEADGSRTRIISFPGLHPLFFEASKFWDQLEFRDTVTLGKHIAIAATEPEERSDEQIQDLARVIHGVAFWQSLPKTLHVEVAHHARLFDLQQGEPLPQGSHCILLRGKLDLVKTHPAVGVPTVIKTCWPGELAETADPSELLQTQVLSPSPEAQWRADDPSSGISLPTPHIQRLLTNYTQSKLAKNLVLLQQFDVFQGFCENTLRALALAMGPERLFTADQVIVAQDAPLRNIGFVLHGKCLLMRRPSTLVAEIGTKDIFNQSLLSPTLVDRRANMSLVCKTKSTVLLLSIKDYYAHTTFEERQCLRKNLSRFARKKPKSNWKAARTKLAPLLAVRR